MASLTLIEVKMEAHIEESRDELVAEYMYVVGKTTRGGVFGQLALERDPAFPDKKVTRAATITTTRRSTFAIMTKKDYRNVLDRLEQKKKDALVQFLK